MSQPQGLVRPLRRWLPLSLLSLGIAAGLGAFVPNVAAAPPQPSYGVSTESPGATREASRVLADGGNAFDAAVCAALVAGFTAPSSSGLGGGGFALVWSARDQKPTIIDFRETAPAAIDAAVLDQRPVPPEKRGQTVGVPGELAGLFELHQRYGKLAWSAIVGRAAKLAARGFAAEPHTTLQLAEQTKTPMGRSPHFRSVYLPGGAAAKLGATLRSPRLSKTLTRIAAEGKRGLYEGPVATDIVQAVKGAGGSLELSDLASYKVVEREPLRIPWAGKEVLTMPPPSAGGLLLAETLLLFEPAELTALNDAPAKRLHLLAEGMRGAAADRARFVGDPAFVPVNVAKLLSPARLQLRKQHISADRTHTQPRFGLEDAGTHHLVVADHAGNWVSLTTTVNDAFGAKLVAEQSGIILNNQLTDFTPPEAVAVFGMTESPNRVRPGARPVSSMSPTLVLENGTPSMALGGSGALTIAPNTTQVLLNKLAYGMSTDAAVAAPRFTIPAPRTGQTVWLESALAKAHGEDLSGRGELWRALDSRNAVQLVARENGVFSAASDPRKQGSAQVGNGAPQRSGAQ
jgi:gamma-glutamyltranspeptidase/glutathione hydrolase